MISSGWFEVTPEQVPKHKIHFLGHIISAEGITTDPSKSIKVEQ